MTPTPGAAIRLTLGRLALLLVVGRVAYGQSPSASTRCSAPATHDAAAWTPPLDRQVVLYAHDVSLRDALDRLGATSGIRFAYSAEFLPLDRRVCIASTRMSVGDALAVLLDSTNVEPFVVTTNQIVLAPSRQTEIAAPPMTARGVGVLERVVVTGSADGTSERPLTVALDVVSASQVRASDGSLSQMLGATVPGMWVGGQSPSAMLAHYGSIRGASSFGLSYPKVYIDGIEVANPLLITQLDLASLERVEVIRGPQGAALYGADAISGVINIITRHDGADASGQSIEVTSTGGVSHGSFAAGPVFQQEHGVTLRSGSNARSADLSIAGSTMGDYIPNFASSELRGAGAFRVIGARTTLSATARLYAKTANVSPNPLLTTTPALPPDIDRGKPTSGDVRNGHTETVFARPVADTSAQSVREYTLGVTGLFLQNDRWTHTLSAGIDGYRLSNIPNDFTPIPSAADSALRAARGAADRGTLRASSVGQFNSSSANLKVTVAAEGSTLDDRTATDQAPPGTPAQRDAVTWSNDVGVVTQLDAGWRNTLFATAGLRGERNSDAGSATTSLLPMLGGAWVVDRGSLTAKLRTAYGRASRPPRTAARQTTWLGVRTSATDNLKPEEQTGIEFGTDVLIGNAFGVHVTRFDQHAFGLIQPVGIVTDTSQAQGPPVHRLSYVLQNVGEITNRGWEMQSSFGDGHWSIAGTLSFVDSRVRRLATGYNGDLRPGDRMLGVPARTSSVTASWSASSWSANLAFSRASDWINYDRLALANSASDPTHRADDLVGPTLRAYWRQYAGVSRLNAGASRDLFRRVALTLSGSNLLNEQLGDPDNVTVLPGRAFLVGLRAKF